MLCFVALMLTSSWTKRVKFSVYLKLRKHLTKDLGSIVLPARLLQKHRSWFNYPCSLAWRAQMVLRLMAEIQPEPPKPASLRRSMERTYVANATILWAVRNTFHCWYRTSAVQVAIMWRQLQGLPGLSSVLINHFLQMFALRDIMRCVVRSLALINWSWTCWLTDWTATPKAYTLSQLSNRGSE